MKALVVALCVLIPGTSAIAQSGPTPGAHLDQGISDTPNDSRRSGDTNERGERLICRNQSSTSATRMGSRRVCHTAAEWREIARQNQD